MTGGSAADIEYEVDGIAFSFFDMEELLTLVVCVSIRYICGGMVVDSLLVDFDISSTVSCLSLTQNGAMLTHGTLLGSATILISAFSLDSTHGN